MNLEPASQNRPRPNILVFLAKYLPGYKAGGALRTIANMTNVLSDDFQFKIVTGDRDSGDTSPYPSICAGDWTRVGNADVLYLAREQFTIKACVRILERTPHDIVYFQSCFSYFTLKPLVARLLTPTLSQKPKIIAPRGELYSGALSIRKFKKLIFLAMSRAVSLYGDAVWQASNDAEAAEIRRWFGPRATVVVAPDIALPGNSQEEGLRRKIPGRLRALFISRICPKKNLTCALNLLREVSGVVEFDIYGPAEDSAYWRQCQNLIRRLPANIRVQYRGPAPHEKIGQILSEYELLLFPTLGENFGHVILESLLAGCPVLISDQTPWRDLKEIRAGWDLPLKDKPAFLQALQSAIDMDEAEHSRLRGGALALGESTINNPEIVKANRHLLTMLLSQPSLTECRGH